MYKGIWVPPGMGAYDDSPDEADWGHRKVPSPAYPWDGWDKTGKHPDAADFGYDTASAYSLLDDGFLNEQTKIALPGMPNTGELIQLVGPPSQSAVLGVRSALEGATGLPVDKIASTMGVDLGLMGSMVGNLVRGETEVAQQQALQMGKGILKAGLDLAFGNIPIVGQIVGIAADVVFALLGNAAKFQAEKIHKATLDQVRKELQSRCDTLYSIGQNPVKTGISLGDGSLMATPSDLFRPVREAYESGSGVLPMTPASVYVLLCGAESQGFGFSRQEWEQKNAGYGITIPPPVQRRMWKCIKAIFSAVQHPSAQYVPGDGGKSSYMVVQELVRTQRESNNFSERSIWMLATELAARVTYWHPDPKKEEWGPSGAGEYNRYYGGNCSGTVMWHGAGGQGEECFKRGGCQTPQVVFKKTRGRYMEWEKAEKISGPTDFAVAPLVRAIASPQTGTFWVGQGKWAALMREAYRDPKSGRLGLYPNEKFVAAQGLDQPREANSKLTLSLAGTQHLVMNLKKSIDVQDEGAEGEEEGPSLVPWVLGTAVLGTGAYFGARQLGRMGRKKGWGR